MKVSVTEISACKRSLSVTVPPETVGAEFDKAFRVFAGRIKIDGFRKGKVPRHLVQQRFGKEIEQEVIETLIRRHSVSALEEAKLRPLHAPVLKDYKFGKSDGLSFVAEFEVRPEVKASGYRSISVARKPVNVGELDVQKELDDLRERKARFEGVEGRGAAPGDFILADIKGTFREGEGEALDHPDAFFEIGSVGPHPELTDELRGMKPGESRTFGVSYPSDHPSSPLAGKRVVFEIALKEIKTKHLAELNEDLARDLGAETLDELRKRVQDDLLHAAMERERAEARRSALDQILEANPSLEVPDSLIDDRIEGMVEEIARSMAARGMDPNEAAIDWDEVRREQREPARKLVRGALLLDAIVLQEHIDVDSAEVEAAIEHEAGHRRLAPGALRARWEKEGRLDALKRQLLREKALDFVLASSNT